MQKVSRGLLSTNFKVLGLFDTTYILCFAIYIMMPRKNSPTNNFIASDQCLCSDCDWISGIALNNLFKKMRDPLALGPLGVILAEKMLKLEEKGLSLWRN